MPPLLESRSVMQLCRTRSLHGHGNPVRFEVPRRADDRHRDVRVRRTATMSFCT